MGQSVRHGMLVVGLGLASPLAGMVACDEGSGGIVLPPDTAGHAGHTHSHGGSAGTGLGGEGGSLDAGAAGVSELPSSGKGGAQTGTGGTHTHGSGGSSTSKGGSGNTGNTGNAAGTAPGTAGEAGDTSNAGGSSGASEGGEGGAVDPGSGGTGGTGADGGTGGTGGPTHPIAGPLPNCMFASDPVVDVPASGGMGGMGGVAGAGGASQSPHGVNVVSNAFLGPYLTDQAGFALYIYGADFPGDCEHPPVSNCTADCAQSWPIFNANERTLAGTLDNAMFGTLDRGDGTHQTTYKGWPLYYYKSDTAPNVINGQGKGKTWFAAEVNLPNLVIMRGPVATGGVKYLGDDSGWTLYSIAGDTPGTSSTFPVSSCTDSCLDSFTPFGGGDVFPCTSLEPNDVSVFLRQDGTLQAAYKGLPLYYSHSDLRSGEENGVGVLGGAMVLP